MGKLAAALLSLIAVALSLVLLSGHSREPPASSQDDLLRAVYASVTYSQEVHATDATKLFVNPSQRLEILKVHQAGDWALVEGRLVWADGSGPVPTSGVIFLAKLTPQGWIPVHRGHPEYQRYLESLPNELAPADKDLLR